MNISRSGLPMSTAPCRIRQFQVNPCVILHIISFDRGELKLHTQLRSPVQNALISQLRQDQVGLRSVFFVPKSKLLDCYKNRPQVIANTEQLLGQCGFDFVFKESKNKVFCGRSGRSTAF